MPTKERHGTLYRYRKGCRCDACRKENAQEKRDERAKAKKAAPRHLTIVDDTTPPPPQTNPTDQPTPGADRSLLWGPIERSLRADASALPQAGGFGQIAMIESAYVLARELDDPNAKGAKGPLVKQLTDLVMRIRGKEAGDGESLEDLLTSFGDFQPTAAAGDEAQP